MKNPSDTSVPYDDRINEAAVIKAIARREQLEQELGVKVHWCDENYLPANLFPYLIHESPWLYYWAR